MAKRDIIIDDVIVSRSGEHFLDERMARVVCSSEEGLAAVLFFQVCWPDQLIDHPVLTMLVHEYYMQTESTSRFGQLNLHGRATLPLQRSVVGLWLPQAPSVS